MLAVAVPIATQIVGDWRPRLVSWTHVHQLTPYDKEKGRWKVLPLAAGTGGWMRKRNTEEKWVR